MYASAEKKISEMNELIKKTVRKSAAESCNQEKDQEKSVEQTIFLVTLNHFEEGIFPWEPANRSTNFEINQINFYLKKLNNRIV